MSRREREENPERATRSRKRTVAGTPRGAGHRPFSGPGKAGQGRPTARQPTLTALHAAATAAYSVPFAPYRSLAAFRVAVRAPA
ncbi:hypothetical protein GCM10010377_26320 [Streptomyces viridiviolaceus]|nr:hypothetical protein GCM10010377_26320 [Streptomyces viridiviolaceus]